MTTYALVLRSGGEYTSEDVARLAAGLQRYTWLPRVVCLSDLELELPGVIRIPLETTWPGWWAKLELFRPDLLRLGTLHYFDLDTIVRGDLARFAAIDELALLRDFYRDGKRGRMDGLGSGLMVLPADRREAIWQAFTADPARAMRECGGGGDQRFLERYWLRDAARLQDLAPGLIASYKASSPEDRQAAAIVCFHGRPKPRDVGWRI